MFELIYVYMYVPVFAFMCVCVLVIVHACEFVSATLRMCICLYS